MEVSLRYLNLFLRYNSFLQITKWSDRNMSILDMYLWGCFAKIKDLNQLLKYDRTKPNHPTQYQQNNFSTYTKLHRIFDFLPESNRMRVCSGTTTIFHVTCLVLISLISCITITKYSILNNYIEM